MGKAGICLCRQLLWVRPGPEIVERNGVWVTLKSSLPTWSSSSAAFPSLWRIHRLRHRLRELGSLCRLSSDWNIGGFRLLPRAGTLALRFLVGALLIPNSGVSEATWLSIAANASSTTINFWSVFGAFRLSGAELAREEVIIVQQTARRWTRLGVFGRMALQLGGAGGVCGAG